MIYTSSLLFVGWPDCSSLVGPHVLLSKHLFDLALTLQVFKWDETIYAYCTNQRAYMYLCVSVGVGSNFIFWGPNILYSDVCCMYEYKVESVNIGGLCPPPPTTPQFLRLCVSAASQNVYKRQPPAQARNQLEVVMWMHGYELHLGKPLCWWKGGLYTYWIE